MDPLLLALVTIRAGALALGLAGDTKTSNSLYLVADAIESGKATDDHMRLVAEKLKERDLSRVDWDDVVSRFEADHARLQGS